MDLLHWREQPAERVLSVSEVNQRARRLLEREFAQVAVVGEVSNFRRSPNQHVYFTLKDEHAEVVVALFAREARTLKFALENGLEVVVSGRLSIYEARGSYQLIAQRIEPRGAGALQLAFEQLKRRLEAEGLFARERKRSLPLLPRVVAVITSPTGAVIRDIVHVGTRRFPHAHVLLVPALVQGDQAPASLVSALERVGRLASRRAIDVVVVARGGGSLEDLWAFNDEGVARAIAACPVPVVSAVGHETDFTIADFVADLRAPTPSAAAELVFPLRSDLVAALRQPLARGAAAVKARLRAQRHELEGLRRLLASERRILQGHRQALAEWDHRATAALRQRLTNERRSLQAGEMRLVRCHPRERVKLIRGAMDHHRMRLRQAMCGELARRRSMLRGLADRLSALSPLGVLERGYAIVMDPSGRAVRTATQVAVGDEIAVRLASGRLAASVRGRFDD